jgi:hypothetical protein
MVAPNEELAVAHIVSEDRSDEEKILIDGSYLDKTTDLEALDVGTSRCLYSLAGRTDEKQHVEDEGPTPLAIWRSRKPLQCGVIFIA